ncbi:MAG TPA: MFS transporter [Acidimicrobiales bacterium]|jgi:DHA1 family multidrug resistance protein-like MFS transporter|nr:MFS transporter [Acidimicrobiales bacterium]
MDEEVGPTSVVSRLVFVVFLEWLGATSVLPLLPLYLRDKGATPATTGAVMAAYFVGAVVFQYVAGRVADRVGRRPVLFAGLVAYAAACLGFLLPMTPLAYGALRFVQGAAAGSVEVATLATVALVVPAAQRGRASSRIYAAQLGGAAFGPLLGAFVGVREMAYVFVFAATAALVAAIPVLRTDLGPRGARGAPLPRLVVDARLVGAVAVAIAFGLVIGVYESCWTLLMHFKGASSFQLGLSWTLFALPYVFFFRVGGWFADHSDRRVLAVVGIVNSAAFCAIYPLLGPVDALLAFSCFEAIGTSLALPAAQSVLTEQAAPQEVGRRQGIFATSQTGALAVSAMVSGTLFERGPAVPFLVMAFLSVAAVLVVPIAWRSVPGRVALRAAAATPPP